MSSLSPDTARRLKSPAPLICTESSVGAWILSFAAGPRWNQPPRSRISTTSTPFRTWVLVPCSTRSPAVMDRAGPLPTSTSICAAPRSSTAWKASTARFSVRTGPLSAAQPPRTVPSAASVRISRQRVIDILYVIVLLQFVQQGHDFGGLFFRQRRGRAAQVFMRGRYRRDAPVFQRLLHLAEIIEGAAHHDLRLALLAGAFPHFIEAVVHQVQLQVVLVDAFGVQAEHAQLAEHEADAAGACEVAAMLGEDAAHIGHGAGGVVRRGLHQHGHAVRRVALVDHLGVVGGVAAAGALDRGVD